MTRKTTSSEYTSIPLQWIGPLHINHELFSAPVSVPLATFESPLWPSTERGARVTQHAGGIDAVLLGDCMTRSTIVSSPSTRYAAFVARDLEEKKALLSEEVRKTSKYAELLDIHTEIVGKLLFIRWKMYTHDAAGHNMTTKAADHLLSWMLKNYPSLEYVSISGNICTDKKVSCINALHGRGKSVSCSVTIPKRLLQKYLKTTAKKVTSLNIKKNFVGSIIAGSVRSANAHFANMLLALYLATGQDAANIIEASQGITYTEESDGDLYFSVQLPNIIVGTIGNGKTVDILQRMGLDTVSCPHNAAKKLAIITCATVLCGELSLLAAQTNPGELVAAHMRLERKEHS